MRVRTILLVLAVLLPCISMAANQVYRWKDAKGVVHFADAPPPDGIKYKIVNIKTGVTRDPPKPAQAAKSASTPDNPVAKPADNTSPKTVEDTPENRAKLCKRLADNIKVLQNSEIVMMGNSGTAMTADQRASQLARAQEQQKQFCSK